MQPVNPQNPLVTFLPLLLIMVPMIFVISTLAKEKGKNVTLWTILACIPLINIIILPYIVGAPSKTLENKLNKILEILEKTDQKFNL